MPTAFRKMVRHRRWTQRLGIIHYISTVAHRASLLAMQGTATERSENETSSCSTGPRTHYHAYRKYNKCLCTAANPYSGYAAVVLSAVLTRVSYVLITIDCLLSKYVIIVSFYIF